MKESRKPIPARPAAPKKRILVVEDHPLTRVGQVETLNRELEVLWLFGQGWGTAEIGEKLHMSPKTVDTHRGHIKEKLGFHSTPEFLRYAIGWATAQKRLAPDKDESTSLFTSLPEAPRAKHRPHD